MTPRNDGTALPPRRRIQKAPSNDLNAVQRLPHVTCLRHAIVRHKSMHLRKSLLLIFCLVAASTAHLPAQEKPDAATIRSREMKWTESYKHRNIDILSSLLADDFVITIEDGSVYSKTGYISHSADATVHVDVADLSDLKVRMHGDTAIVTGAYHEKGQSNGKPYEYRDRFTDTWMKIGGKWQVVASHYSVPYK